jgi:hypothetical protein
VDLAREERLKKCDIIIEYFEKILCAGNVEKILNRKKEDDVINFFKILVVQIYIAVCRTVTILFKNL